MCCTPDAFLRSSGSVAGPSGVMRCIDSVVCFSVASVDAGALLRYQEGLVRVFF